MALTFSFDQIKLAKNENVNNSVLNRPLARLYTMLEEISVLQEIPESNATETVYLADVWNESNKKELQHTREWHTINQIADAIPKPALTDLTDVSRALPLTGQTITWNQNSGKWEFRKLPVKITDIQKFELVDDNPVNNSVMTWNSQMNSWIAQTVTKYIGVGYIYHQVCTRPTVIKLPTSTTALSGGEQIVITKIKPVDAGGESRYPVLITVPDKSATIIGRQSILTDNESEDWASIHLRAVVDNEGKFMWVPVAGNGTWKPTEKTDLTLEDSANIAIDRPPALTENQIKLQPYNISINTSIGDEDISKTFDIKLVREGEDKEWMLDTDNTSDYVYYSANSNVFTINHNILDGLRLVRTTVYFKDDAKLSQITPNEIYFDAGQSSQYAAVNIDLSEWLIMAQSNELEFKVLISI